MYIADGIHPNHAGYLLRVKIMRPLLGEPDKKSQQSFLNRHLDNGRIGGAEINANDPCARLGSCGSRAQFFEQVHNIHVQWIELYTAVVGLACLRTGFLFGGLHMLRHDRPIASDN